MKYREEMAAALLEQMRTDPKVLILGEGVTDPKGVFGTTLPCAQEFPQRVVETPLSENMMTGACFGMALEGWKPVFVHARVDFMMLAMEHLVNTSAKWRDVHDNKGVSMVVRGLVGRGWGQGPNHSQAFHAMFAHVPGLRVLYPVNPEKVSYWMNDALNCGSPTVVLEPRRVYEFESLDIQDVDDPDIYIVTFGDVVLDAALAAKELLKAGVKAQVHPIEDVTAMAVPQTEKPVVICDTGHLFCGATAEVAARLAESGNSRIKRVGPPFVALPTSMPLEKEWYPSVGDIVGAANKLLDLSIPIPETVVVGDRSFRGPF